MSASTGNIYTVMFGQQPIGMARADNPQDAIELIQRLCEENLEVAELRLRKPTPGEMQAFEKQFGTMIKEGVLGFLL